MSYRCITTIMLTFGFVSVLYPDNCHPEQEESSIGASETAFRCPVGKAKADSSVYLDYEGKRYYFCCAGCRKAFEADPEKYIGGPEGNGTPAEDVSETTELRYEVFGMDCPGCHGGVEKLVKKIPGVVGAQADYRTKEMRVEVEAGAGVTDEEVFEAVRKANFTPGKRLE